MSSDTRLNAEAGRIGPPVHGARHLEDVSVDSYSLLLEDDEGMVGDQASATAFRQILKEWHRALERAGSEAALTSAEALGEDETVRLAEGGDAEAIQALRLSISEFSSRLADVIQCFLRQPEWAGVERIVIGGGFKESDIGRQAIRMALKRLLEGGTQIQLRTLHNTADDGGLVGWMHLHPQGRPKHAFLAVDIGGTNVRCGIVAPAALPGGDHAQGPAGGTGEPTARVLALEKWRHAENDAPQNDLVEGIVGMLRRLIAHARDHRIRLLPFIGIACPGLIRGDGSIERGAQNLPGDWRHASFHLPRRTRENIPHIDNAKTLVLMHNDAVVQGLSELPYTLDVKSWAVLTIGTGLGNASFTNHRTNPAGGSR